MMKLFSHAELPFDLAVAVALVGPFRVRMGQLADDELASTIEFPVGQPVVLGQGAATVTRNADDTLSVVDHSGERQLNAAHVARLAEEGRRMVRQWPAELTYPVHYVGTSHHIAMGENPRTLLDRSWRTHRIVRTILCDDDTFETISERLLTWKVHNGAGIKVDTVSAMADINQHIALKLGPLRFPALVIDATVTDKEVALTYGTIKGHVETGEETFMLTRDGSGLATARVAAFSRHTWFPERIGATAAKRIQDGYTRRYLQSMLPD